MSISVFLADDHAVVRDGLKALLDGQPGITVVGTAGNGPEAVKQITRLKPDIAVLDISMPELSGIEATRKIAVASPGTRVIVLSMHSSSEHIYQALKAGALGYVLKESATREIVDAIHAVHLGSRHLCRKIDDLVIREYLAKEGLAVNGGPLDSLSEREREVLLLVVQGRTSAEIAKRINLSPKTVETYRSRLMQKLGVHDLPGLVRFAIRHRLIEAE